MCSLSKKVDLLHSRNNLLSNIFLTGYEHEAQRFMSKHRLKSRQYLIGLSLVHIVFN